VPTFAELVDLPGVGDGLARGDALRKQRRFDEAIDAYLEAVGADEVPPGEICLRLARCYARLDEPQAALQWVKRVVDAPPAFATWQAAGRLLGDLLATWEPPVSRRASLAVLGSYTTTQLPPLLRLTALRRGVLLDVRECAYGQYRQEIIDPGSALYREPPDVVLLAVHEGDLALPDFSADPEADIEAEVGRWVALWRLIGERSQTRVVQHNFAVRPESPFGHLSRRAAGTRAAMVRRVNDRLGEEAGASVSIVDCDHLSAVVGKRRWFDDVYWHVSKQAVSLDSLPELARHTAAVVAAELGLSKKCIVLDLDNTLWGGVIGEDGLAGLRLGGGAAGEAYVAFQEFLLRLKERGVLLAVCSKNDDAEARRPFEQHPEMRLRLDDIAVFVANWESKADNLRVIAHRLGLGLDALVFVDDNPVERDMVRQFVPEVEVVMVPSDPAHYVWALANSLLLEPAWVTPDDALRAEQYRARAQVAELQARTESIDEFHRSLEMRVELGAFDELHLPRVAQLVAKTNQFNLTGRRHGLPELRAIMTDPNRVSFYLRLRDRFADHGIVGVVIAERRGDALDIDTFLMSCRVIGRTVEAEMLAELCRQAELMGCLTLSGTYVPSAKNAIAADVFSRFGFERIETDGSSVRWGYDVATKGPIVNTFIRRGGIDQ
jgi:FkbH-like protein